MPQELFRYNARHTVPSIHTRTGITSFHHVFEEVHFPFRFEADLAMRLEDIPVGPNGLVLARLLGF